jgi:hypothetical protein
LLTFETAPFFCVCPVLSALIYGTKNMTNSLQITDLNDTNHQHQCYSKMLTDKQVHTEYSNNNNNIIIAIALLTTLNINSPPHFNKIQHRLKTTAALLTL